MKNKMDLSNILTIPGKPGLYKMVGQMKNGAVVQSLLDGKRFPAYAQHRISALEDISIYGEEEEKPLGEIMADMYANLNGEPFPTEKMKSGEMLVHFQEIFPDYDEERVYESHIKKVYQWYNLLLDRGFLEPEEEESKEEETKSDDSKEDAPESGKAEKSSEGAVEEKDSVEE